MGSSRKPLKRAFESQIDVGYREDDEFVNDEVSGEEFKGSENDYIVGEGNEEDEEDREDESNGSEEEDEEDDGEDDVIKKSMQKNDEMHELEKEYRDLKNMENVSHFKNTHLTTIPTLLNLLGLLSQITRESEALWDKALELRFLLQKSISKSNKLPQEPIRSSFCEADKDVYGAYSDLIASSQKAIESLVHLEEALLDNNPLIGEATEGGSSVEVEKLDASEEKEWVCITQALSRVEPFRNKSVDKWQRKADVHIGAAAKKVKLLAFNQNISEQVATYMRDPSKMIRSMQIRRKLLVGKQAGYVNEEGNTEGDPELLDDSEFYQQLLKEFFETIDPNSSESAFHALKRLQTKKRRVVDRRASKSRKIRYHVHEKIVNFMALEPMDLPPMVPKLFENLFGLKTQKSYTSCIASI